MGARGTRVSTNLLFGLGGKEHNATGIHALGKDRRVKCASKFLLSTSQEAFQGNVNDFYILQAY
jgi:hypothetical protein